MRIVSLRPAVDAALDGVLAHMAGMRHIALVQAAEAETDWYRRFHAGTATGYAVVCHVLVCRLVHLTDRPLEVLRADLQEFRDRWVADQPMPRRRPPAEVARLSGMYAALSTGMYALDGHMGTTMEAA